MGSRTGSKFCEARTKTELRILKIKWQETRNLTVYEV